MSYMLRKNLLLELVAIGILTIIVQFFIYRFLSGEFPGPRLPHFKKMILGSFLLGVSLHFILEIATVNEKWCRSTYFLHTKDS